MKTVEKIIIGLVGEAASGKGTVAAYLTEKYGASTHQFSRSMKDCLARLHIPFNRDNASKFALAMIQTYGDDVFAKVIAKDCQDDAHAVIVVDGVRRLADISILKTLPGFHLLYVTAPVELRWERARKRGEKAGESEMTLEQFKAEEELPTELAIKEIGRKAEFMVDNSGEFDELYTSMESIIEYIKAGDFDHPHPHRNTLHPTL